MAAGFNWFFVLSSVFLVNLVKTLLPSISSFLSKIFQKDADQEMEMRTEIQNMKMELSTISMMDEFARYARLERKINKMTDQLKTLVKSRTSQQAKMKWIVNIVFYILQVGEDSCFNLCFDMIHVCISCSFSLMMAIYLVFCCLLLGGAHGLAHIEVLCRPGHSGA
uniref:Guided entry of tail-anchored proteins factor 1 n=1 Tax=Sinocyclocheilus grahami TaxID=75366 RepID=A0A672NHC3_SINGR